MNTSHLKNGLNGCLDDGIRNITRRTLCALGKGDLIGIQSSLEKWQSDGILRIRKDIQSAEDLEICVELLGYIDQASPWPNWPPKD